MGYKTTPEGVKKPTVQVRTLRPVVGTVLQESGLDNPLYSFKHRGATELILFKKIPETLFVKNLYKQLGNEIFDARYNPDQGKEHIASQPIGSFLVSRKDPDDPSSFELVITVNTYHDGIETYSINPQANGMFVFKDDIIDLEQIKPPIKETDAEFMKNMKARSKKTTALAGIKKGGESTLTDLVGVFSTFQREIRPRST